ncbi:MAG TPA: TlyA family RNA methyltransferase [Limnochorda sp.]
MSCGRGGRRLDQRLVDEGLFPSREQARRAILAGEVQVDGQTVSVPGHRVPEGARIEWAGRPPRFVSRGGEKLDHALATFGISVQGLACLDVGASTGGFTDCLLQRGARRVYAVDVGYGQLAWKLRQDPRVVVLERTNVRYLEPSAIPEPVDLATVDVSFISVTLFLDRLRAFLTPEGQVVILVKPQFEAGRGRVGKGGVVRSPEIHREVIAKVWEHARSVGLAARGLTASPLLGPAGNREFLLWLRVAPGPEACPPPDQALIRAVTQAPGAGEGSARPEL